ncbi:MAG: hypothetical protein KJ638_07820 [Chloroflexi bacterium]|nr:hypothetical protein [Chloroflexota bacterium]
MLGTFVDKISGFFDRRFVIAHWMPALTGLGLALGLAGLLLGPQDVFQWWTGRSETAQAIMGLAALLGVTLLAFLLDALTTPLVRLYEGYWSEGSLTRWARKRQQDALSEAKNTIKETRAKGAQATPGEKRAGAHAYHLRYYNFPRNAGRLKPTQLGNVLSAAEEYPHQMYSLDAVIWWPRMATSLPEAFSAQIDAALTPMLALLNLSTVFIAAALGGTLAVLPTGNPWWAMPIILAAGLLLARLCYGAAVSQATGYAQMIRVAFDLYRQAALKQMHIPVPDNLVDERRLWSALNTWVYHYIPPWEAAQGEQSVAAHPFYYDKQKPTADRRLTTDDRPSTADS